MYRIIIMALAALAAVACGQAGASPSTAGQGTADQERLLELVERLLGQPTGQSEVFVGVLPPGLDVPLPTEAEVLGGVTYAEGRAQGVLDVPLAPEAALAAFEESLEGQGWAPLEHRGPVGSGFVPSFPPAYQATFCGEGDRALYIVASEREDGTGSDVRLMLSAADGGTPCDAPVHPSSRSSVATLLPQLQAPPGVSHRGGGGGGSNDYVRADSRLQGDISPTDLEAYYRRQLEDAGWALLGSGDGEGAAWSQWRFQDDQGREWAASLVTAALPGARTNLSALIFASLVAED